MILIRRSIQVFLMLLFTAFGTDSAWAMPSDWHQTNDPTTNQQHSVHVVSIGFAARAPPLAVINVEVTGGVTVMRGSASALHGQETVASLFGFGSDLNVTNRTLTQIDNPVDLVGFRRDHIINRHGPGSGRSGKTEFPSNWDEQRILHNISDVATDPNSRRVVSSHGTQVYGVRDGVEIRVDLYPDSHPRFGGQISTGFPVAGPNAPVNP